MQPNDELRRRSTWRESVVESGKWEIRLRPGATSRFRGNVVRHLLNAVFSSHCFSPNQWPKSEMTGRPAAFLPGVPGRWRAIRGIHEEVTDFLVGRRKDGDLRSAHRDDIPRPIPLSDDAPLREWGKDFRI